MSSLSLDKNILWDVATAEKQVKAAARLNMEKKISNALPPPPPDEVAKAIGSREITIDFLAGDGSDRSYYRLRSPQNERPLVLMQLSGQDALALKEDGYDWIKVAKTLRDHGIFVPAVTARMPEAAALIIEDYGDIMLEDILMGCFEKNTPEEVESLYRKCFETLGKFLTIKPKEGEVWCTRSFDEERLLWELNFFLEKCSHLKIGLSLTSEECETFKNEALSLSKYLASGATYFVHRDFHSRNVMVQDGNMAIIDFQDARLGTAAYDLVSLCFDSYIPLSDKTRSSLLKEGIESISKISGKEIGEEIKEQWKPVLLQRQLKAIGSFAYLSIDKDKGDYLKYFEPAIQTLEQVELKDERWPFLSSTLITRLRQQLV